MKGRGQVQPGVLDQGQKQRLIAMVCSSPPQGRARWTVRPWGGPIPLLSMGVSDLVERTPDLCLSYSARSKLPCNNGGQ